ncbi:DUF5682 family protein [Nocardioides sp. GXZ039]|uniref:DUF5682 family protein n=1 Tax=Nocardioides sp. GXZ039 TaxID=3136018 RepID=UPI0030F41D0A
MPPAAASSTDRAERICWVPVRHHSPAAARVVGELIATRRPDAVLVEGPADYRDLDQLLLGHSLPIAILSWLRYVGPDGADHQAHALYPLTSFSPEWQAIECGTAAGARVEFIDLPWSASHALRMRSGAGDLGDDVAAPAVRDAEPGRRFFETLAGYVGREDMSAVWDEFFEIDPTLSTDDYLRRAEILGTGLRESSPVADDAENRAREAHMAARIRAVLAETTGPVLVVVGAFHVAGLRRLVDTATPPAVAADAAAPLPGQVTGHGLVPTSYVTLDQDAGYLAGQPTPGFYERVFEDAAGARPGPAADSALVNGLLADAVAALRRHRISVSAADLIAALTTARGLQQLRGHARLWRDDLVDGIAAAVVKDDLGADRDTEHPMLREVRLAMRGDRAGRLAAATAQPPLVDEARTRWAELELPRERTVSPVSLDLQVHRDRERSRLLHALRILEVPAAELRLDGGLVTGRSGGTSRSVVTGREGWAVRWHEGVETALILASRWGGSLHQAVAARLEHRVLSERDPGRLAEVLVESVAAGIDDVTGRLGTALGATLGASRDLPALGAALDALVRLVHYDTWAGAVGRTDLEHLLRLAFDQGVQVLATLPPQPAGPDVGDLTSALRTLAETATTLAPRVDLDVVGLARAFQAQATPRPGVAPHAPEVRGGLVGADWLLTGDADAAVEATVGDPAEVGEFYVGLMAVAGHLAIAAPRIFDAADQALAHWSEESFLAALPDLRRAMGTLNGRERGALLTHLTGTAQLPRWSVDAATAVQLAGRESALWNLVERHVGPLGATSPTGPPS